MDKSQEVFHIPPDSARKFSNRLFSGSQLQRIALNKKTGRRLIEMRPNLNLSGGLPRVFRPVLTAYLIAGSTVLRMLGINLELEVEDE